MEHGDNSSHMASVSDGRLQGTDSCLGLLIDQTQQSPGRETKEDEGRQGKYRKKVKGGDIKGDGQLWTREGERMEKQMKRGSNSTKSNGIKYVRRDRNGQSEGDEAEIRSLLQLKKEGRCGFIL